VICTRPQSCHDYQRRYRVLIDFPLKYLPSNWFITINYRYYSTCC
jgi:hypothetical protein